MSLAQAVLLADKIQKFTKTYARFFNLVPNRGIHPRLRRVDQP